MCVMAIIPRNWYSVGSWNPDCWMTRNHLSYINNTMAVDDLVTQGACASTVMVTASWHSLSSELLLTWIKPNPSSNHMPSKVWNEINFPFPNFNSPAVHPLYVVVCCKPTFDILRPGYAYMCYWTGPSLVQVMACRLFGTKPLHEPYVALLSGVLDLWDRNKIFEWWWSVPLSSASLYESFFLFCLICVYSSQFSISFWIMYLL